MNIYKKIQYPCGLMLEIRAKGLFGNFNDDGKIELCPLHDKNCYKPR